MTDLLPCQRTTVSTEESLAIDCPLCRVAAGEMCIYMVPGYVRRGGRVLPTIGLETVYPHQARRRSARKARFTDQCICWCQVRPKVCLLKCCGCVTHRERKDA